MSDTQTATQKLVSEPTVNQTSKTRSKMTSKGARLLCLLSCLGVLQTEVALSDEPNAPYRVEAEIEKQVSEGHLARPTRWYDPVRGTTVWEGVVRGAFISDLIRRYSLYEKAALAQNPSQPLKTPLPQIHISGITVNGPVYLNDLDVWSRIRFDACTFKGDVFSTGTVFRRGLSCHICTFEREASFDDVTVEGRSADFESTRFEGRASFDGMRVEGSANFGSTRFNNSATFNGASIGDDLKMSGSRFQKTAEFIRLRLGSDLDLDGAEFLGDVSFLKASIGKFLLMRPTSFGTAEANFNNLKVGEDALILNASFHGPVQWDYGEAKGIYYTKSTFSDRFRFNSNKVSNSVSFEGCKLGGQLICNENKISGDLNARDAYFRSINFVSKNQPAAVSQKRDDSASPFDVDFFRTKVEGIARLDGAAFDGSVSFERADIQDLSIAGIQPWPRKNGATPTWLTDATVKYFHADSREGDEGKTLLRFVDNAEYDEGLYIQLEQFLKSRGYPEEADEVFIRGKQRAKDERLKAFSWPWIRSWILDLVTAYGRQPWRALAPMFAVVAVGAFVFRRREDMDLRDSKFYGRRYSPIWYSLDVFAPIIDLEAASVWAPRRNRFWRWQYLRFHRLMGWILIPIAIAAITGLLQGGPP